MAENGMRKVRLNRELHERALNCADAIGEPLAEFVRCCLIHWSRGSLKGVAVTPDLLSATCRDVVVSIYATDLPADMIRQGIAAATIDAEARRPKPFQTGLVAGKDYIVEEMEE